MFDAAVGHRRGHRLNHQGGHLLLGMALGHALRRRRGHQPRRRVSQQLAVMPVWLVVVITLAYMIWWTTCALLAVGIVLGRFLGSAVVNTAIARIRPHSLRVHPMSTTTTAPFQPTLTAMGGWTCNICTGACDLTNGYVACPTCKLAREETQLTTSESEDPVLAVATDAEAAEPPVTRRYRTPARKQAQQQAARVANLARAREALARRRAETATTRLVVQVPSPVVTAPPGRPVASVGRGPVTVTTVMSVAGARRLTELGREHITPEVRSVMAAHDLALPDGSYPIGGPRSLERARKALAIGRTIPAKRALVEALIARIEGTATTIPPSLSSGRARLAEIRARLAELQ